jgi:hypothetical protein
VPAAEEVAEQFYLDERSLLAVLFARLESLDAALADVAFAVVGHDLSNL